MAIKGMAVDGSYWVSCRMFTVRVDIQNGIITFAAPIVRWSVGKPLEELTNWAKRKCGSVRVVTLTKQEGDIQFTP